MSKETLIRYSKYATELNNRLSSPTPEKHKNHPAQYKQFLNWELKAIEAKIEDIKMSNEGKK